MNRIADVTKEEEVFQKRAACVAILACNFSKSVIDEGFKKAAVALKPKVQTKQGYKNALKRNYTLGIKKDSSPPVTNNKSIDALADQMEVNGRPVYYAIETEPNPYLKNYHQKIFSDIIYDFSNDLRIRSNILRLDLTGQLIGNQGLSKLSNLLVNSPIEVLVLTNNDIDDDGIKEFSKILRSLSNLSELFLNSNKITDSSIEALCHSSSYSFSLKLINLARNHLTRLSAYDLGLMFTTKRHSKVSTIILISLDTYSSVKFYFM